MVELNNIYNQDVFDYLVSLEDNSIDLAIIDPPYNQNIDKWDTFNDEEEYFKFTFRWIDMMLPKIKSSGSFYIFNNPYNSAVILNYLRGKCVHFRNWIVWYKKDGFSPTRKRFVNNQEVILFYTMSDKYVFNYDDVRTQYLSSERLESAKTKGILKNGKRWYPNEKGKLCSDVWEFASERHKSKIKGKIVKSIHPTPKPVDLIQRIVLASSNKGDLVLDLFSGTGTTSFVALEKDRFFTGCENNKIYYDYIVDRLNIVKEEFL